MASADRLIEVFTEAKARPAGAERDRFLSEACQGDSGLKQQVFALLQAHEGAGDFLKYTQAVPVPFLSEMPGDRIGRYKLLEQIGQGGCGVVYMAEQEEPVRRRVALKVIKLGMDTKNVIARFEAERQALALMDHANIAKVLDAGATDTGRPYFVMELVRGIKITDYCDQNNISTEERLKLFAQVCQAIQHAHQKGIIHRDIKPSNILVTVNEPGAPGCPKVIDFGIAKATTDQRLTDKTVFTAFEQFIGTPAYMSPEQAMMTSLDIDTRTDIYALGVLLYELLTGTTPFDAKDLVAAGLDAMRRIIHEQEPARPSTRLSTMLKADLTTVAKHRHSDPAKLGPLLRGDLDWIVMKALEKDRTRRYETANGLAMDIQRHLDNEPVTARPPSNLYRFQKLVRRNRLAVAAAGAVTAALIFGLGVSTWMFFKEKEARQRAVAAEHEQSRLREQAEAEKNKSQTQAVKSQQVASFLESMLKGVGPGVALGRDTTLLREILDKTAARIGRDLTNQPEVELELRITLFNAYLAIGEADKNEEMARSILRLTQSFAVAENVRAEAWLRLGFSLRGHGKLGEAEQCGRQALAAYRKVGGKRPGLTGALMLLSQIQNSRGRLTEAEALCREAVAVNREMFGNENVNTGNAISALAHQLRSQGKLVEAESVARESLAILRNLGRGNGKVVEALLALTGVLGDQGKWAGAEELLRDELAPRRQREHPDTIRLLTQLGHALQKQGRLPESEAMLRGALASARKTWANNPSYYYYRENVEYLLEVLTLEGKLAEVETLCREELAMRRKLLGNERPEVATALHDLAGILRDQGKLAEAETLQREALTIWERPGNENPDAVESLISLVWKLHLQGRPAEVEARAALTAARKVFGNEHRMVGTALQRLGTALSDQGKHAEAEVMFRDAVVLEKKVLGEHVDTAHSLAWLAGALEAQGKVPAAEAATREALEIRKKLPGNESWAVASLGHLATLLLQQGKYDEAKTLYHEVAAHADALTLNGMAWLLATSPDPKVRDGRSAVAFAQKAAAATSRTNDMILDTLAAAYAETGQFTNAVSAQQEAIVLLQDEDEKKDYASRLELYQSGSPHRDYADLERQARMLHDQGKLADAEAVYRELLPVRRKRSADDTQLAATLAGLTQTLIAAQKFTEAETIARECLAIREQKRPDDWLTFNARSMLGGSLLGQKKFPEAEPLLLSGYEGMKQREAKIPAVGKPRLRESLQRLVQLYEATGQSEKAAEWSKRLNGFEEAETHK